jgi:hypothetical protein
MRFLRYWAKASTSTTGRDGRRLEFACWRGSDLSVEDARAAAQRAAEDVAARAALASEPLRAYAYGDRLLREEIVRSAGGDGERAAVVTRNSFGCLVLNTAGVLFVDVDLPRPSSGGVGGWLGRLFGRGGSTAQSDGPQAVALAKLEAWLRRNPGYGFRVYRTRGGLRYLETSRLFDPTSDEAATLLGELGCDPLYMRLCRSQQSFRARLTPKPWRCGLATPPSRFPHETLEREAAFQQWLRSYDASCARYAVCEPLPSVGDDFRNADVAPVVELHDEATRSGSGLPLA